MSTSRSDAGSAMSMATYSENAHSITYKKKETQKAARTKMDLYNQRGKDVQWQEGNQLK
jgi:hypothetical protein